MSRSSGKISGACGFCQQREENESTGHLYKSQDGEIFAHYNCMLFSSGLVTQNTPDLNDFGGFHLEDVRREMERGQKLRCSKCKAKGATVGCDNLDCKRTYHYECAKKCKAKVVEEEEEGIYKIYCHHCHMNTLNGEAHTSRKAARVAISHREMGLHNSTQDAAVPQCSSKGMRAASQDVLLEQQEEDDKAVQAAGDTAANQEPKEEPDQHVPPPQEGLVKIHLEPETYMEAAAEEPSYESYSAAATAIAQQHAHLLETMAEGMAQMNTTVGVIAMELQGLRNTVAESMAAVAMELQTLTSTLVQLATHVTTAQSSCPSSTASPAHTPPIFSPPHLSVAQQETRVRRAEVHHGEPSSPSEPSISEQAQLRRRYKEEPAKVHGHVRGRK